MQLIIHLETKSEALISLINTMDDKSAPITFVGVNWKEE